MFCRNRRPHLKSVLLALISGSCAPQIATALLRGRHAKSTWCQNGLISNGTCCAASCEICGGNGCGGRPGGASQCCKGWITSTCASVTQVGCSIPNGAPWMIAPCDLFETQGRCPLDRCSWDNGRCKVFNDSGCVHKLSNLTWKAFKNLFRKENVTGPVVLWDPATHNNIGDNLIALGTKMLLENVFHREVIACCASQCEEFAACDGNFFSNAGFGKGRGGAVVFTGGGNWGDLYTRTQSRRLEALHLLADCCSDVLVVGFPEGIYYTNETSMKNEARVLNSVFQRFKRKPVLYWRDKESADLAEQLYSTAWHARTPDAALAIGPLAAETAPSIDLLISTRTNPKVDQVDYSNNNKAIHEIMSYKYPSLSFETSRRWSLAFEWDEAAVAWTGMDFWDKRLKAARRFLEKFSVIITDKMHMAITSMLMGKTCIYVDNIYHKLNRTFESMFDLAKTSCDSLQERPIMATSFAQAIDIAVSKLHSP